MAEAWGTHSSDKPELAGLLRGAAEARAAGDLPAAACAYAAAIAQLATTGDEARAYALRLERAICLHQAGDYEAEQAELDQLEALAAYLGAPERRIAVSLRHADLRLIRGDVAAAQLLAARALADAEAAGAPLLKAESLLMLAQVAYQIGEQATARARTERALALFRAGGNRTGEGAALRLLGRAALSTQPEVALAHLREALAISRAHGDRSGEALALNALGAATADYAEARATYQQGLAIAEQIGDRVTETMLASNLGAIYLALGLYRQAWRCTTRAVRLARTLGTPDLLAACLATLGRSFSGIGQIESARVALREAYALAEAVGSHATTATAMICLARADIADGRHDEAGPALERAAQIAAAQRTRVMQAAALAWRAAAHLMASEREAALTASARAVALIEDGGYSVAFPLQEVWWQRFRALSAASSALESGGSCLSLLPATDVGPQIDSAALLALGRAREAMYAAIATLGDAGLRRGYLNRVGVNRAIIEALASTSKVARPRPPSSGHGSLHDQLTRVLAVSARLNELRDGVVLRERLLDELVELSGAERLLLLVGSSIELPEALSGRGLDGTEPAELHAQATPLLREALRRRQALLHHEPGVAARTAIAIPLISGAHTVGALYGDVRDIFGPFTSGDLDLIVLLSAQAATAFENARLYQQTVQSRDDLEQQVAQRTTDMQAANAALQRRAAEAQAAFAAAEAASAAKSAFLANVSHELRTPLNAVIGFAQVLERDQGLSPSQRELVTIIARSGDHLLGLINDVLEMARMEAGGMSINPAPFDLHRLLNDLEDLFRLSAEQHHIGLSVVIDPALPRYVVGDEGRLRQVLLNLLSNALKFTRAGEVCMSATAAPTDGHLRLRVSVADTGEGIAPGELELLFRPFVQTGSGRRSQEGTGLGLALSRQLARLMGGDISVSSTRGVGSIFVMEVLLDQAAGPVSSSADHEVIGLVTAGRRYRALVASSVWQQRRLYAEWLRQAGLEAREAADEAAVQAICEQWRPHLVLLTMGGPGLDGYELARQLKASPSGRSTLVLALIAEANTESARQLRAIGCDDVIAGQVRFGELLGVIAGHLGVDLRYAAAAPNATQHSLSPADLDVLPESLRARLAEAAAVSDPAMIEATIGAVRAGWPELGARLGKLADEFEFEQIEHLALRQGS